MSSHGPWPLAGCVHQAFLGRLFPPRISRLEAVSARRGPGEGPQAGSRVLGWDSAHSSPPAPDGRAAHAHLQAGHGALGRVPASGQALGLPGESVTRLTFASQSPPAVSRVWLALLEGRALLDFPVSPDAGPAVLLAGEETKQVLPRAMTGRRDVLAGVVRESPRGRRPGPHTIIWECES